MPLMVYPDMQHAMKKVPLMLFSHAGHATILIMLHLLPPVQQETARQGFCMHTAGLSGVL